MAQWKVNFTNANDREKKTLPSPNHHNISVERSAQPLVKEISLSVVRLFRLFFFAMRYDLPEHVALWPIDCFLIVPMRANSSLIHHARHEIQFYYRIGHSQARNRSQSYFVLRFKQHVNVSKSTVWLLPWSNRRIYYLQNQHNEKPTEHANVKDES